VSDPHPKVRARRIEVRREEGRKRRHRLVIVAAVLAVAGLAVAVVRSPVLDVDRIEISGTDHTSPAEVRRAAGIRSGAAMIDLDTGAAAQRIEARPWVAKATVHRSWPSTVEVRITERRAVAQARVGDAGPWSVLDGTGRVLAEAGAVDPGLVTVTDVRPGSPGSSVGRHDSLELAAALTPRLRVFAGTIEQGGDGLRLVLRNGVAVRFGSAGELDDKLFALDAILTKAEPQPAIATIDVRVPTSPVLTRKPALTTNPDDA
jgi:cell division protein FtsQ